MKHVAWLALLVAACGGLEAGPWDFPMVQSEARKQLIKAQAPSPSQFEDWLDHGFDPWEETGSEVIGEADDQLLERLLNQGVAYTALPSRPIRAFSGFDKGYHTFQAMEKELHDLAAAYPGSLRLTDFGDSWETTQGKAQRNLWGAVLGRGQVKVLLFAALHARELVTTEMAMHLINDLVTKDGQDPNITQLLNRRQVWVVPMMNPDGHIRAEQGLSWRKNTNTSYGGDGVDLNRNFGWEWGGPGSSNRPGDATYRGPKPFSEPETQALKNLMERERFQATLSWHSFSNLVLWPWGYTHQPAPDKNRLSGIGQAMAQFSGYEPEQSSDLYVAAGDSEDWLYGTFRIPAYTIEIGTWNDGFDPPFSKVARFWQENRPMAYHLIDKAPETAIHFH